MAMLGFQGDLLIPAISSEGLTYFPFFKIIVICSLCFDLKSTL